MTRGKFHKLRAPLAANGHPSASSRTGFTHPKHMRRGAALVEFALCMPPAMLLLLATVEITRSIQLQHTLQLAVYEGARTAALPGAKGADIEAACRSVLDARGASAATVQIDPAIPEAANLGDFIKVTVSVPASANQLVSQRFMSGKTMTAVAEAMKEY